MGSILISASVAAVVTLLVEYLAKPSLEARKDSIIEAQRLTRSVAAKLALADHLFTKLSAVWNQDSPMQSFENPETTMRRVIATIDPVMEAVASGQMRATSTAQYAVMAYVALVEFWRDDVGGDERANAENARELCQLALKALSTQRWQRHELASIDETLRRQGLAPEKGAKSPLSTPWQ